MNRRGFLMLLLGLPLIGPVIRDYVVVSTAGIGESGAAAPTLEQAAPMPLIQWRVRWYKDGRLLSETWHNTPFAVLTPPIPNHQSTTIRCRITDLDRKVIFEEA